MSQRGPPPGKYRYQQSVQQYQAEIDTFDDLPEDNWFYVNNYDDQIGPVSKDDFKAGWLQEFTDQSLFWNETMPDWIPVAESSRVLEFLKYVPPGPEEPKAPSRPGKAKKPRGKKKKAREVKEEPSHGWQQQMSPQGVPYFYNSITGETSWDKPEELKTDADREKEGEWVWMPDQFHGYVPAKKISERSGGVTLETEDGEEHVIKKKGAKKLEPLKWYQLTRLVSDLVMLDEMNKPLIVHSLRERFKKNEIYTNVGTILISINPYKMLPLYTPTVIESYINRGSRRMKPHVYAIADDAFRYLRENREAQSIVISGESGAGKTECTKQALQYLAEIAGSTRDVSQRILLANPVLETFGNAKTVRNNNSSRFGKYVEIIFDKRMQISGAMNTNYLLEKIRVVYQMKNERNYHIFYQLINAADDSIKRQLKLNLPIDQYHYVNQSGCIEVDGIDDHSEWKEMLNAMTELKFDKEERMDIFKVIAGVLHLGNIQFRTTGDRQCSVSKMEPVNNAASLLQVDKNELQKVMTTKLMRIRGQPPTTINLGKTEAEAARDALSKFIYEKNFDWLVQRINKSIGQGERGHAFATIGILDIFGFEIFEQNQFEQLCINFANEKLQQFFNLHTFKKEEKVYSEEKIKYSHVTYVDNQPVLNLIEKKPNGILPCIDEELRIPKGSDKTFVAKLVEKHSRTKEFKRVLKRPTHFIVNHYAGAVEYDSAGFLVKNKDRLTEDAYKLLTCSKFKYLKRLFNDEGSTGKETLGSKFRRQLTELMKTLNHTEPHYIRCIKPNPNKAAMEYVGQMCLEQLQYSGVFEAVEIRKKGFPFRLTHERFWKRYKCTMGDKKWQTNYKANCKVLIGHMEMKDTSIQIGVSKVLYRANEHRTMDLKRNLALNVITVYIQKFCRLKLAKTLKQRCLKIRPILQKAIKSNKLTQVTEALIQSSKVGFKIHEHHKAERVKYVYEEGKRLNKILETLVLQDVHEFFDNFKESLASADDIELNSSAANQARAMYQEAVYYRNQIDEDAVECKTKMDKSFMIDTLDRADGIEYSTPILEEIRRLINDTSGEQFLKIALKAAVSIKDHGRVVRRTIKLKRLVIDKNPEMFKFKNFGKLYRKDVWADLKFFSLKRDELAMGMLRWTKDPIHISLLDLTGIVDNHPTKPQPLSKMSCRMFKNILGYMGDRKYSGPVVLAMELMSNCLKIPPLRDEIYLQLIKQLTNNLNPESKNRGWELMQLCLDCFHPQPEFESYLEQFLLFEANPADQYVNLMHQTLYGGCRSQVPSQQEMQDVFEWKQPFRLGFDLSQDIASPIRPAIQRINSGEPKRGAPPGGPRRGAPPGGSKRGAPPGGPKKGAPPGGPKKGAPPKGPKPPGAARPEPEPEPDYNEPEPYNDEQYNDEPYNDEPYNEPESQ